jgi:hypothetical protein
MTELDHSRIKTQRLPYIILYGRGSIIAHEKVVSFVVDGLMFSCSLGEGADTPVRDGSNCAAGVNDEGSGCAGDTGLMSV